MLHFYFAPFLIYLVAGYSVLDEVYIVLESSSDELRWPDTYTLKATKYSLTSNLVQDYQIWQANSSVRVDYNNGAVKSVTTSNFDGSEIDFSKYEIHPVTEDGETAELVCNQLYAPHDINCLKDSEVLPASDENYEFVGNETLNGIETVKYESIEKDRTSDVRKTVWAYYDNAVWVPVRYEEKQYNPILGSLTDHDVWEYTDFSTEFDEDVFDIIDICESSNTVKHNKDSEKITRELMFINPNNKKHVEHVYNSFVKNFARVYANEQERALRKTIFKQNMRMVSTVNKKKLSYTLAINHFSDRTPEEMNRSMGLKRRAPGKSGNIAFPYDKETVRVGAAKLPSFYDARVHGLVGTVKNQADCGSCWTYGTTAAMEGALARANGGRLMTLSNQALVDCVWEKYGAAGCDGGTDNAAYEWMMDYGLPTEEEYGVYKNKDDYCHIANVTKKYPIRGFTDVTPFSDKATKLAVAKHGPLSTSVHVTTQFSHYSSGIYYQYDCDPTELNHEVALVGYGESDGELFWILKNSWGSTWGIDGYMHISAKDNTCGTTTEPTYVVI